MVELARGEFGISLRPRLPENEGVSGYVISSGKVFQTGDIRQDPLYGRSDVTENVKAVVCAPLIAYGVAIGALWVGRKYPFNPGEVRLVTAIADIAANAIHRSSLFEKTRLSLQRLAALHEIDTAINSTLDLQITLKVLLEQVINQLRVDAAAVLLLNPQQHTLTFRAGRGFRTRNIERATQRLGEGHAGKAALDRKTIQVHNIPNLGSAFLRSGLLASEGFVSYFATPLVAKGQVKGVLEVYHRSAFRPDEEWLDFLETLAGQAAIAIDNASLFVDLQRLNDDLILAYDETIEGWSHALDMRDHETEGHTRRVTEMTDMLARTMGLPAEELVHVRWGALLHDIGKMCVPDSILSKPGPLDPEEWVEMRKHPVYAYELLYPIKYLRQALDIPYCHHEKWDGTGYPRGLKGKEIPLSARIFAVVDVWDALRSPRVYRKEPWEEEKVRAYIRDLSGSHFDPDVAREFLAMI